MKLFGMLCPVALIGALLGAPLYAQVDLVGEWGQRQHEDQPERGPGPELGDYLGLPINAAARAKADAWDASLLTLPEWQCRPHPADYIWRGPSNLRISKEVDPVTRQITAFHAEWLRSVDRPIYLDGRPHPDPKTGKMGSRTWNPSWLGHSVGRWEGDTLVIDTVGFNDRSWFMTSPHTEQLHVIERLRRPDLGHLEIDVTAEDPGAFSAPWKRHLIATIGAKDEEIEEFICNEDNIDISHLVGK